MTEYFIVNMNVDRRNNQQDGKLDFRMVLCELEQKRNKTTNICILDYSFFYAGERTNSFFVPQQR